MGVSLELMDLQNSKTEGLHYSAVYSLSLQDIQKVKSMIINLIAESRKYIESSPEEYIAHIQVSFFQV